MPAYVAAPAGAGRGRHGGGADFTGMSHDLRNQADWLASEGFLAAAPDLYYWGSRLRCLWTIMREVTAGKGRTVADIDAARDWLAARADCTGRIGVSGFLHGRRLRAGAGHRARVRGGQHQLRRLPQPCRKTPAGACPVVGSYGGKDRSPMGASAAARLETALTALGVDHDIKVYPGAGHGFINDHDPADQTLLLTVLSKISGTRYHEPSARDAHRRIAAFLGRHLAT
jgi:carboxymethylenebutenolidase